MGIAPNERDPITLLSTSIALDFLFINGGHVVYEKWVKANSKFKEKQK